MLLVLVVLIVRLYRRIRRDTSKLEADTAGKGSAAREQVTSELWCREVPLEGCTMPKAYVNEFRDGVVRAARSREPGSRSLLISELANPV